MLTDLAGMPGDNDDMMRQALDMMGTVELGNMVKEMQAMPKAQQRGAAATMDPTRRDALMAAGWSIPEDNGGGGFFGKVKSVGGGALGVGARAVGFVTSAPVIKQGLQVMDWAAEEATRPTRVTPLMDSGRRVLDETGYTESELEQRTGIRANASSGGDLYDTSRTGLMNSVASGGFSQLVGFAKNPGDMWKAVQTWNEIGHEGQNDYLPEVQYDVYQDLEDQFSGEGKDMLRWAKALAAGSTIQELADSEGLSGAEAESFIARIGPLSNSAGFRQAMSKLESGRVSPGRSVARALWNDADKDVSQGKAKWVSGSVDAVYAVAADPTVVGGKLSKAVKAAKWGIRAGETVETLDRAKDLTRAVRAIDEGADAGEALSKIRGGVTTFGRQAALEAEGRALLAPAKAVSDAFESGDFGKLARQYPGFERSIGDMKKYDAALKAAGEDGLTNPEQVFEFYKHAAGERSVLNAVDDTVRIDVRSTKLFGHDGGGKLMVPHATRTQRAALNARGAMRDWLWDTKTLDKRALDDLKTYADEVSKTDEAVEGAEKVAMEIDPQTLEYVKARPNRVKKAMQDLTRVVTTQTTGSPFITLGDEVATTPEQFRKFNESVAIMAGDSKLLTETRYNRFVTGNIAERRALVNQMISDMGSATGMNATEEGAAILRKHIDHNNQVYGLGQDVQGLGRQAVMESQLAEGLSVPSFKEMMVATRNVNKMRWVAGTTRKSVAEAAMTRVWKPGQILKLGFPLRAGADEMLGFIGRVSLTDYLERNVLEKWAGLNDETGKLATFDSPTLARAAGKQVGDVIAAPAPAIAPVRSFTKAWANIWGVTDEALTERAFDIASRNPEWAAASQYQRLEMLQPHLDDLKGGLKFHSKSLRWIDDTAHNVAAWNSKVYHQMAVSKYVSRKAFADNMLKVMEGSEGYAARLRNRRLQLTHPFAQEGMSELAGATFNGLIPDVDKGLQGAGLMGRADTESGYQFLRTARTGDYAWLGHDDLGGFYQNLNHWMQNMAQAPSATAVMDELLHYVPEDVLAEARKVNVVGLDGMRSFRSSVNADARGVLSEAAFEDVPGKVLRKQLEAADIPTDGLDEILNQWDDLSPKTRYLLTDGRLFDDRLTDDLDLAMQRASNGAYNALYKLDGQSNLRKMVRAQYVNGKPVAEGVADGHTRIYAPMVDRRNAEDLVRLLSDPDMAQTFAERLGENLKRENLFGEMSNVWGAAPPGAEGYDMASWMAGLKASIAQGNGSYVPGLLAGSSNPKIAEAIRDSLEEILPEQTLRPTIGYLDHPDELLTANFGLNKVSQSVVDMSPYQSVKLKPIDPDSLVRLNQVQMKDGTRRWLSEAETEGLQHEGQIDKVLQQIHGNGVTEEVAVRATAEDILHEVRNVFIGQQSGTPLHEIIAPLRRGEWSADKLVRNVELKELPTKAFGPSEVLAHQGRWDRFVNRALQGTAEPIIGAISRMPMYSDAFDKASQTMRAVFDNAVHKGLDDEARALLAAKNIDPEQLRDVNELIMGFLKNDKHWGDAGDDLADYAKAVQAGRTDEAAAKLSALSGKVVTLTDDDVDVLRRWHLNQSAATEAWVHRSTTRAMEMVTPYIDDHRLRSAFQEYIGPVFAPYYYAEEQFLRRFARGIYETPHMLRKGQLLMNGMRNLGVIREDAYGNEMFVIPGSELLTGAIADVATLVTGNDAFQVLDQPLTMRTEYVLPGWNTGQSRFGMGPIVGLATEGMTRQFPELEWRRDDPNRKLWEYVVPGPVSGAYKAFLQDGDPTQIASAQMAAIAYLEANGHGLPEDATATQRQQYLEDINQVTKSIGILRYVTGQLTFTGATPLDTSSFMRKDFTDILADGASYDEAMDIFLERHGPEAAVYTIFGTENETGAPLATNSETNDFMLANEDLVRDAPAAMAWLLPQGESTDKFDRRAYNQQLALGLRRKRSPDEMLNEIYVKQAAETYWDEKDKYDAQRSGMVAAKNQQGVSALDDQWENWKRGYLAQHPVFAESFSTEAADRRKQTLTDVEWLIEAQVGGKQAEEIAPMVRAYRNFRLQYDAYADQSSKAARKIKADMLSDYFDEQWAYVQAHPKAQPFWNSVLRPELPDAADDLERNKLAGG